MADGITGAGMESGRNSTQGGGAKSKAREMKAEAAHKAEDLKDKVEDKAGDLKDKVEDKADDLKAEAREKGKEMAREGKARARSKAEEQKERVSTGLLSMADALRRSGEEMPADQQQYGRLLDAVADRAEDASHYLAERDVDSLGREMRTFARENTPILLGGAFTLGLLGARFLKASPADRDAEYYGGSSAYRGREAYGSLPAYETREPVGREPVRPRDSIGARGTYEAGVAPTARSPMTDRSLSDDRALEAERSFEGPEPYELDEPNRNTESGGGLNE